MKVDTLMRLLLALICVIMPAIPLSADEGKAGKRLVIINSYNEGAPWAQDFVTRILQEVSSRRGVATIETIHLNCTTIHNAEDYEDMAKGLFRTLANRHPDYLVLIGNFAFTLRDRFVENWGDLPMVLISMSDSLGDMDYYFTHPEESADTVRPEMTPISTLRDSYNFTMVVCPNKYRETVDMMRHMFPGMRRLVFIADPLYVNRALSRDIESYINAEYPGMDYEWLVGSEENGRRLKQYLDSEDPSTGLLLSTWFYEKQNVHGYPQLIAGEARMISGITRPVFGLRYSYLDYGILGGVFVSPERSWHYARRAIMEMLAGHDLRKVPVRTVKEAYPVVNYPVLEKDGYSPDICPPGTRFIDRPETLWEQYWMLIIACGVAFVALIALVAAIAVGNRRTRRMLGMRDRLIKGMPVAYSRAIVSVDGLRGISSTDYTLCNDGFGRLLSMMADKSPDTPLISAEHFREALRKGAIRFTSDFHDSGIFYEFFLIHDPSARESGCGEAVDVFAVDITELKRKEAMLIKATEKAEESDRLKLAFLANMSHEIRTPLNAIVGFSDILCNTSDPARRARFVNIIHTNNQLLLKLINDVLDVAKIESNTLEFIYRPVELNALLADIEGTATLRVPEGVTLECRPGREELLIETDPDRLNQVLANLLSNASKFTAEGSITFGYDVRANDIRFYVRDTGKGISPEDLPRLFTRFTKLDRFTQGNGLGLSICKSIVERLGGEIGVESTPGSGTLFWFTLPLRPTGEKL